MNALDVTSLERIQAAFKLT
ncbi:hypothetical protein CGLO_13975 [Colletotrichum gloeosporioides Cg-14]|uniref:Uncharacterized protein n=1 Tax=Colletotrichum gloeosporioides (strain Cg-14) TaxID=1237896 RepID=T0L5X9_COLGC|nr:hypothetical protein CGLO_13975 [Colletotrichum gloeosporioides Cg-14]